MEIRDPVHGPIELNKSEALVVDSPAFQRLRSIKQLGFGEYSFPGATHNRYLHSLGAFHLAGLAFDSIFENYPFQNSNDRNRIRNCMRMAALLHDVGHGPLSHASEEVMPHMKELKVAALPHRLNHQAHHEDFTIKFITDSALTDTLRSAFPDMTPLHVACVIDPSIECPDDFFVLNSVNLRPLLCQVVSSELDVDRMDYLTRDAYFCGAKYGFIELDWLIDNLTYHQVEDRLHLALSRRALYSFDDFLISRHHMYLMIYFHHKCIIYDEMLHRYLTSSDCNYRIPANIDEYLKFTDYQFYQFIYSENNKWAQRIAHRNPLKMIFELHETHDNPKVGEFKALLDEHDIEYIHSSSQARLSKYHPSLPIEDKGRQIYIVDQYNPMQKPYPIEQSTQVFQQYETARRIDRVYVDPARVTDARNILNSL